MNLSSQNSKILIATIFVHIVTVVIYFTGLNGPLIYDDHPQLGPLLDSGSMGFNAMLDEFLISNSGPLGRPISMFTFILNANFSGTDIWWWKFTNLLIHLIISIFIYLFTYLLLNSTLQSSMTHNKLLALIVMSIWIVHPLNVSTVLYTVQRMTQLSALFSLIGMVSYLLGRKKLAVKKSHGWVWIVCSICIFLPAAMLSKETGALLIIYLILIETMVFKGSCYNAFKKKIKDFPQVIIYLTLTMFFTACAFIGYKLFYSFMIEGYTGKEFTLYERMLTQSRVLIMYLAQIVFPHQGLMGFYHDDVMVSKGLLDPVETVFSGVVLCGMLLVAWFVRKKYLVVSFGIFFFLTGHFLESTIFPLEMMFEHRNYLPMLGILLAAVYLLSILLKKSNYLYAVIPVLIFLTMTTFFRADVWSSQSTLFTHQYKIHPDSEALTIIFANNYINNKDYKMARNLINKIPGIGSAIHQLFLDCSENSAIKDESLELVKAIESDFTDIYALTGLTKIARTGLEGGCEFSRPLFVSLLSKILNTRFKADTYKNMLVIYKAHYTKDDNLYEAIELLETVFQSDDSNPVPLFLATHWLLDNGDVEAATIMYERGNSVANDSKKNYSEMRAELKKRF